MMLKDIKNGNAIEESNKAPAIGSYLHKKEMSRQDRDKNRQGQPATKPEQEPQDGPGRGPGPQKPQPPAEPLPRQVSSPGAAEIRYCPARAGPGRTPGCQ